MDSYLIEEYVGVLNSRSAQPRYARILSVIREVQDELNIELRPDAWLFLANNLFDLVVQPLREGSLVSGEFRGSMPSQDEIFQYAREDIRVVLQEAEDIRERRGSAVVSGSSAIEALGRKIRELRLDNLQIWGD